MNNTELTKLQELATKVTFKNSNSIRRRMGVNGINALSVYEVSKWHKFGYSIRKEFRLAFPEAIQEKAFMGWFLRIPVRGFIDKIATWVDKPASNMSYYSVALNDNQKIIIDEKEYTFNTGEVCEFNIKSTYEIPVTETEQLWACILVAN